MGAGILSFIIRPKQIRPGWVALYVATAAIAFFCAFVRGFLSYPLIWVALQLTGQSTGITETLALIVAYTPLALSLGTLILPLGGWWWQQQLGGRPPSGREQLLLDEALTTLRMVDPRLRGPHRWFVIDDGRPNGAVYANRLMLTRGLLESPWLAAILAHELGHLHSSDGRLSAAIWRLTVPPRKPIGRTLLRMLTFIATGELAMWIMRGPWGIYWRGREHHADHYAASLGQAEPLAEFLDIHALPWDLPVPFQWLTDHSHPSSEHRIDRLYQQQPDTA